MGNMGMRLSSNLEVIIAGGERQLYSHDHGKLSTE